MSVFETRLVLFTNLWYAVEFYFYISKCSKKYPNVLYTVCSNLFNVEE